jgi:hypothetical protein
VVQHSGQQQSFACHQGAQFFGDSRSDPYSPEVWGLAGRQIPTTGSTIAKHGGDNPSNRDVADVVYAPRTVQPGQPGNEVETPLVTPTTLKLLGLSAGWLQAAQWRGHAVLPGPADREEALICPNCRSRSPLPA